MVSLFRRPVFLAAFFVLVPTPGPLQIAVSPRILSRDGYVRLVCRTPPRPENRWLEMGIVDYTSSLVQLDGDQAPVTHLREYAHLPCGEGEAFCRLTDVYGRQTIVRQTYISPDCTH